MKLDENQLKEFHENGFLVLKNFADSQTCDEILQKAKIHLENKIAPIETEQEYMQNDIDKITVRRLRQVYDREEIFRKWMTNEKIRPILKQILNDMEKIIILCVIFFMVVFLFRWKRKDGHIHGGRISNHHHKIGHKHGEGYSIDFYAYASKIRDWNATFKVCLSVLTLIVCIIFDNPYISDRDIKSICFSNIVLDYSEANKGVYKMIKYIAASVKNKDVR